jgi:hypothetical protein
VTKPTPLSRLGLAFQTLGFIILAIDSFRKLRSE